MPKYLLEWRLVISRLTLVLLLILAAFTTEAQMSGSYTIGGAGANFQSFNAAAAALASGVSGPVTLNVNPGIYNEQVTFPAIPGASATNRIKINGNLAVINFTSTVDSIRCGIILNGTDHFTIDRLIINGENGTFAWGVLLTNAADSNTISNCVIKVSKSDSIYSAHIPIVISGFTWYEFAAGNNGNYNRFINNEFIGGYHGISVYGDPTLTNYNKGNVIKNNVIREAYANSIQASYQTGMLIDSNDISRPTRTNSAEAAGIFFQGNQSSTISNNRIHGMFDGQTSSTRSFKALVTQSLYAYDLFINNLVYDIKGNGPVTGIHGAENSNSRFYHNTVVLDNQSATDGVTYGITQLGQSQSVYKNNVIQLTRSGTGKKYMLYLPVTQWQSVVFDNNVYHFNPGGNKKMFAFVTTQARNGFLTFEQWQALNTSDDQNSVSIDPTFRNPATADFTPAEPTISGIGVPVGVNKDIIGNQRDANKPDPGAYEFTISGLDAGIKWSRVTPTTPNQHELVVRIRNIMTDTIRSLQLSYSNATDVVTETFTSLNILPGDTQSFKFTTPFNQTELSYLRAYINLVNGRMDSLRRNDTTEAYRLCKTMAGNYTINSVLPDGNRNFNNFTSAVAALVCSGVNGPVGITAIGGSGPYEEQIRIPAISGASSSNTITFDGNNVTVQAAIDMEYPGMQVPNFHVIRFDSASHIRLKKLKVRSLTALGEGVGINAGSNNVVDSCDVAMGYAPGINFFTWGIRLSETKNNIISNNDVHASGGGIYEEGGQMGGGNVYTKNNIYDFYEAGLALSSSASSVVSHNKITRRNMPELWWLHRTMGILFSNNTNCLLNGNQISLSDSSWISLQGISVSGGHPNGSSNTVMNNIVYGFKGSTGPHYGIIHSGYDSTLYIHNTVVLDDSTSTVEPSVGMKINSSLHTGIKNNIIHLTRGGSGSKHALSFEKHAGVVSNTNLLYVSGSGPDVGIARMGDSTYSTLAHWQSAKYRSFDQASVETNPAFVDIASGNLKPTASAANNIGDSITNISDINGIARGSEPDPGAYEYTIAPCSNPPSAGTVTISELPACPGKEVTLSLTGNSFGEGQTFQWQVSSDSINWTAVGGPQTSAPLKITPTTNQYYRVVVSCNSSTPAYSAAKLLNMLPPISGTFTINKNLPTGAGNFRSFSDAIDYIRCSIDGPVIFNVTPSSGPYNEQVIIPFIKGASATNTIRINGNGNSLSFNSTSVLQKAGIKLDGSKHIIVENLTVTATGSSYNEFGYGIHLENDADHNTIKNCVINTTLDPVYDNSRSFTGIVISNSFPSETLEEAVTYSDSNMIIGNRISGGYAGIAAAANFPVNLSYGNIIKGNTILDFYHIGIHLAGNTGAVVDSNDISRLVRTKPAVYHGIQIMDGCSGTSVSRNKLHDPFWGVTEGWSGPATGIYIQGNGTPGNEILVKNNLIFNFHHTSGSYGFVTQSASHINYYNNSVKLDGPISFYNGSRVVGMYNVGSKDIQLKNNIISVSGNAQNNYCLYMWYPNDSLFSDHNDLHITANGPGTSKVAYRGGIEYTNLTDWQTSSGNDLHSITADPLFVSTSDLHLTPGSPARNKAVAIATVQNDIDGDKRDSIPDLGADEIVYTFIGNGNWSDSSNWKNNMPPPNPLTSELILVDPSGEAILNVPFTLSGGKIILRQGKRFSINGNLTLAP
jgi:trimeric autotransporter adhesin